MELKKIEANGLTHAYYEAGDGDQTVICIHGFPDTADTWRDLMPVLAENGFRVIAPFTRGYYPTEIPADADYSTKTRAADIIGIMDALNTDKAILIGHDWGAAISYSCVSLYPDRFTKLVAVAIPHPRATKFDLPTLIKARHFITFQRREAAVNWMKKKNYQAIATFFKRWSPNWNFTEQDVDYVREAYKQEGGVEAALGYYWSFWENRKNKEAGKGTRNKIDIPTLCVFGSADGALNPKSIENNAEHFTEEYQQVLMMDAGHFLHREEPEDFAKDVLEFLNKT